MACGLKSGYIQLGAQRVKVRVVPKLYARERLYGEAIYDKNVIRLAGDVVNTQAVDALFHEIGHFFIEGSPLSDKDEEYIAGAFGRGLASLFRDNPEWIKTILDIFREETSRCQGKSVRKQTVAKTPTRKRRPHRRRKGQRQT